MEHESKNGQNIIRHTKTINTLKGTVDKKLKQQ